MEHDLVVYNYTRVPDSLDSLDNNRDPFTETNTTIPFALNLSYIP